MPRKREPVVCPKCKRRLLAGLGKPLIEGGCDIYCPYCRKWYHIKGTKE